MRHNLPQSELDALLAEPLVSTLATYRRDGHVLLSPVWHEWLDGGINICIGATDVKIRHVRRDPRAGLVVYDQRPPYRGLQLTCTPRVLETSPAEYRTVLRRIAVRYIGERSGNAYADASPGMGVVLRLEPGEVRSWDFADDFATD